MNQNAKTPTSIIPAAGRPIELPFDPTELLTTLDALTREYTEAVGQLRQNRERRGQLQEEIDKLDAEARSLKKRINHPDLQLLLKRLQQMSRQPL